MISFMLYSWLPPGRIVFRCIHVHKKRPWVRLGSYCHTMSNLRKLGIHLRSLQEPHPISRAGYIPRKPTKIYVDNTIPVVFRRLYEGTWTVLYYKGTWTDWEPCIYSACVHFDVSLLALKKYSLLWFIVGLYKPKPQIALYLYIWSCKVVNSFQNSAL